MATQAILQCLLAIAIFVTVSNSLPLDFPEERFGEGMISLQNPENAEGASNTGNTDWGVVAPTEIENPDKTSNLGEATSADGEGNPGKDVENGTVDNKNVKNEEQNQGVSEAAPSEDEQTESPSTEKSTTTQPPKSLKVAEERPTVAGYGSLFLSRNCPPHVRCAEAPKKLTCHLIESIVRAPTVNGFAHSDCCPVHICYREDGSRFYHFGLEVEDTNQHQHETKQQSTSFSHGSPGGAASNYNYRRFSSSSSSNQNSPAFFPSSPIAPSRSRFLKGPLPLRYQSAPAKTVAHQDNKYQAWPSAPAPASRPDPPHYSLQQFGAAAALAEQRRLLSQQGSSAAQVVNPEHETGIPMDLPAQLPAESGAGPYSVAAEEQSPYGRVYGGSFGPQPGDWSRYQRNVFGGPAYGMNSPVNPGGAYPFYG